jgi:hypothetical protein
MSFLDRPFDYIGASRTSRDICRDACAFQQFKRQRMPKSEKALYVAGLIGFIAAIAACLYT